MDLRSESSAIESVEDNEINSFPDVVSKFDGDSNEVKVNGVYSNEIHEEGASGDADGNGLLFEDRAKDDVGIEQVRGSVDSPSFMPKSLDGASPSTSKGFGLRKWRRIKRDVVKEGSASAESGKALKRGLSGSDNLVKPSILKPVDTKQNSEGSVGSVNFVRNSAAADALVNRESDLESRLATGAVFITGADSDNSEDRSSKSSTAASAPRAGYDLPGASGTGKEKNKPKGVSSKSAGSKGKVDSSKKARGERVKIKKENSQSSMESDSRSSNFVFSRDPYAINTNGEQNGRSMNYDGENRNEDNTIEHQFGEEVQMGYDNKHVKEAEINSSEHQFGNDLAADSSRENKEDKSKNHHSSTELDPLVESIRALQSVQEALESEVNIFREIGSKLADSTSTAPEVAGSSSCDIRESGASESKALSLIENVKNLEGRLEEAESILKMKESRVAELEAKLNTIKSLKEEPGSDKNGEAELENYFKLKTEAEIENVILSRTIQKLRVVAGDQIALFKEQETLANEQVEVLNKLGEAKTSSAVLKEYAGKLESYCEDILETEEVLITPGKLIKVGSCFIAQLVLLFVVFYLVVCKLSYPSGTVIPT